MARVCSGASPFCARKQTSIPQCQKGVPQQKKNAQQKPFFAPRHTHILYSCITSSLNHNVLFANAAHDGFHSLPNHPSLTRYFLRLRRQIIQHKDLIFAMFPPNETSMVSALFLELQLVERTFPHSTICRLKF